MLREPTTREIYHGLVPSDRTGTIRPTMRMRLAVLALALIAATPSTARADATAFFGRNSADKESVVHPRLCLRCQLAGHRVRIRVRQLVGRRGGGAAVASHDLGKHRRSDLRHARSSFMGLQAGACIANALGTMKKQPLSSTLAVASRSLSPVPCALVSTIACST